MQGSRTSLETDIGITNHPRWRQYRTVIRFVSPLPQGSGDDWEKGNEFTSGEIENTILSRLIYSTFVFYAFSRQYVCGHEATENLLYYCCVWWSNYHSVSCMVRREGRSKGNEMFLVTPRYNHWTIHFGTLRIRSSAALTRPITRPITVSTTYNVAYNALMLFAL